jgi:hypothetical protein
VSVDVPNISREDGTHVSEELRLAGEYRKHAKALRAAAAFDGEAKTSLLLKRIARAYDVMADALEGIDLTNNERPQS